MKKGARFILYACLLAGTMGSSANEMRSEASEGGEGKIPITITAGSTQVIYDGMMHSYNHYSTIGQLAAGDSLQVSVEGGARQVGDAGLNVITSARIVHTEGVVTSDVTSSSYVITLVQGKINITQEYLLLQANGGSKPYDGTVLTANLEQGTAYQIVGGGLVSGETIAQVQVLGSQTEVGESTSSIDLASIQIRDAGGADTTSNYQIDLLAGTLRVTEALNLAVTIPPEVIQPPEVNQPPVVIQPPVINQPQVINPADPIPELEQENQVQSEPTQDPAQEKPVSSDSDSGKKDSNQTQPNAGGSPAESETDADAETEQSGKAIGKLEEELQQPQTGKAKEEQQTKREGRVIPVVSKPVEEEHPDQKEQVLQTEQQEQEKAQTFNCLIHRILLFLLVVYTLYEAYRIVIRHIQLARNRQAFELQKAIDTRSVERDNSTMEMQC